MTNINLEIKIGDKLTVDHDVIDISGNIILKKNQKVTIKKINRIPPNFSNIFKIYLPERINSIKVNEHEGTWVLSTFKETKNMYELITK
ncbi:MAG: hypothetical protein ACOCVF_00830 [bacterium]